MAHKHDSNFGQSQAEGGLRWIDSFDESVSLRGLAWLEENRGERSFRRLPTRPGIEEELSPGVQALSHCPAGAFLSFFTDSATIALRMEVADREVMDHMPGTGQSGAELFFRAGHSWYPAATARPPGNETVFTCELIKDGPGIRREFRLYLPLYKAIREAALGVDPGARLEPSPSTTRPVVFYGTSITQGGCASTAGSGFVSEVGRLLDREVINLGFSGNGKGEPVMARLVSEIEAEMFVLDYAANVSPEELRATLAPFISILREKHPTTPIVLVGNVPYNMILWDRQRWDNLEKKRDTLMAGYLAARQGGDEQVYFVDGLSLLQAGGSGYYVDGVHPTSGGFAEMARNLAPQLSSILIWTAPER